MTLALVPLRDPGLGKTRLRGVLSSERRAALAGAMLADVVAALRDADVAQITVAAGGHAAAAAASALGVDVSLDPPGTRGLDGALAAAAQRLGHACELLVVAADLPELTGEDVLRVLRADAEVVVAPTQGGGTGGLVRRPGDRIVTGYGANSAARHLAFAEAAGASAATVRTAGFLADVDTEDDLARLNARRPLGPATTRLLDRWSARVGAAG
jgi:2-phospho-L-lactate/phosphoenolpyruvate guanylyltransferase